MAEPFRSPLATDANAGLVALVTGGGTGLGRAIAREYARTGASLAIAGRRPEPLEEVRAELEASGTDCLAYPADVREPEQVAALVDAVVERFGRVDALVNNAGGQFVAPPENISAKGWRAVHRLNVDAVWELTRTVAERSMIPGDGGLVVFIGFSPRRGIPFMVHSSAARAALERPAASRSSGAGTGSARSASRPVRSTRRRSGTTGRTSWPRRRGPRRSAASRRRRRSRA